MSQGNHVHNLLFSMSRSVAISQTEAEAIIEPFAPPITQCIVEAFQEFDSLPIQTRSKVYPGTRGQFITNLIWERIRDGLTGMAGIEFCDELHFFKVRIEDRLIVRFKRLNKNLLAISEDTDQALEWFANKPLRNIPGHLLRLNFGYQPSGDWKSCNAFFLTHQSSFTHLEWVSSIPNYADAVESVTGLQNDCSHGLKPVRIVPLSQPAAELCDTKELA